jgi:hypothetical protein
MVNDSEANEMRKFDLKYIQDEFYYFSGQASTITRQLALGGLGFIWIFRIGSDGINIPQSLIYPLGLLIFSLGADLIQYIYGSIIWGGIFTYYERKGISEKSKVHISRKFNGPTWFFFSLKILSLLIAYILLMIFIGQLIFRH